MQQSLLDAVYEKIQEARMHEAHQPSRTTRYPLKESARLKALADEAGFRPFGKGKLLAAIQTLTTSHSDADRRHSELRHARSEERANLQTRAADLEHQLTEFDTGSDLGVVADYQGRLSAARFLLEQFPTLPALDNTERDAQRAEQKEKWIAEARVWQRLVVQLKAEIEGEIKVFEARGETDYQGEAMYPHALAIDLDCCLLALEWSNDNLYSLKSLEYQPAPVMPKLDHARLIPGLDTFDLTPVGRVMAAGRRRSEELVKGFAPTK